MGVAKFGSPRIYPDFAARRSNCTATSLLQILAVTEIP